MVARFGRPPGLAFDDLVHAGWLACALAMPKARTATYPYERARFAMLDELRSARWVQRTATGWRRPALVAMPVPRVLEGSDPRRTHRSGGARTIQSVREAIAATTTPAERGLTAEMRADLAALFARVLSPAEETVMSGLLLEGDSLALIADRCGKTLAQLHVYRWRACAKVRAFLRAAAILLLMVMPLRRSAAQSMSIGQTWTGPVVGERHAPIIKLSLGRFPHANAVPQWCVRECAALEIAATAFPADSARPTATPALRWTSIRPSIASLTSGDAFTCKKAGDARVRLRWVRPDGSTIAADSSVIVCHP